MNRRSFLAALPLVPAVLAALSAKADPETLVPGDYTLTEYEFHFKGDGHWPAGTRVLMAGQAPSGWRPL